MALRVIGAGLGRTGTLSLKLALEHIGFGPCYHMTELMAQASQRMPAWFALVRGAPDWETIFDGFASTVDYPTCTYWRELAAHYPDAKVILSDRDADGWFDSVRQTIFAPHHIETILASPLADFMRAAVFGPFVDHLNDREWMTDYFNRWREQVIAGLPPERLLVHRASDGWEPLCRFLGVPVPSEPYPRVNSKDDMLAGAQESGAGTGQALPAGPEDRERQMQAYLARMNKLAWG